MIKLTNIRKVYQSNDIEQIALDGIDLTLPDKGFVAIYGASGCGKTTLLNILGGLDKQTSGEVIFNGRNTLNFSNYDWDCFRNQEVGFIFQNYYLLPHLTVRDNIAVTLQMSGQNKGLDEKIDEALKEVDILNLKNRYPRAMSGGQQQRVAIARALVSKPSIILADEPTGALDAKNSVSVMQNLKKVSEKHLVVMVTHNEKLAEKYADRLIEISYGKIISDTAEIKNAEIKENKNPFLKVHLPFKTSLKWSGRNVLKKKSRSIPIMIASAIGLAAVGIVISMTVGINGYVLKAQEASLGDFPVYVSCLPKASSQAHEDELVEYPDIDNVLIEKSDYYEQEHYTSMAEDFMAYMDKMPQEYYTMKDSNSAVSFNMLTKSGTNYMSVSSTSHFTRIAPSQSAYTFINNQYKVLKGHLPIDVGDCVLVIDKYNRLDVDLLKSIGFDTTPDVLSFDSIIGKEYRVISNNSMYYTRTDTGNLRYVKYGATKYEELYEDHYMISLKICGIIREKEKSTSSLFNPGVLYSPSLTEFVKTSANLSDIGKMQLAKGVDYNVMTGLPFEDVIQNGYKFTANFLYEQMLFNLGIKERITSLYYFTGTFEDRANIINYFKGYTLPKDAPFVLQSKDYLEQVTSTFSSLVDTFSGLILVFSFVSIFISAILTAILTYISVLERKREIGLLRSLGARRYDISLMFLNESFIIGAAASVLAISLIAALTKPVGMLVLNLVKVYNSKALQPTLADVGTFQWWIVPAVIIGSLLLSGLSALIPAIIAGKKKPADSLRE